MPIKTSVEEAIQRALPEHPCTTCGQESLNPNFNVCVECDRRWLDFETWYQVELAILTEITEDYAGSREAYERAQKVQSNKHKCIYLLTFTRNPKIISKCEWVDKVIVALRYKWVKALNACLEHPDSNIHVHARIETDRYIKKQSDLRTFLKKCGNVDVRLVKTDNGIPDYFTGEIFTAENIGDLKDYYMRVSKECPSATTLVQNDNADANVISAQP